MPFMNDAICVYSQLSLSQGMGTKEKMKVMMKRLR